MNNCGKGGFGVKEPNRRRLRHGQARRQVNSRLSMCLKGAMRGQGNGEGLGTTVCPDFPAKEKQTRGRCLHEADTASQHDETHKLKTPELTTSIKERILNSNSNATRKSDHVIK